MKVRQGFVSNSSSSSFIVGSEVDLKSITLDKFKQLLGDFEINVVAIDENTDRYTTKQVHISKFAERILEDFNEDSLKSENDIIDLITGEYNIYHEAEKLAEEKMSIILGEPFREKKISREYYNCQDKEKQKKLRELIDQFDKLAREFRTELAKPLAKDFLDKNKFVYVVEYYDNEGEEYLEHQEIFRNFNYKRISHH